MARNSKTKESLKTYSEIKLRNPDKVTCKNMATIISHYGSTSASKALTRLINDFPKILKELKDKRDLIEELENAMRVEENKVQHYHGRLEDIKRQRQLLDDLICSNDILEE